MLQRWRQLVVKYAFFNNSVVVISECIRDSFSQQQYLLWVDAFLAGHFQITKPNLCFGILFEYELFVVEIFIEKDFKQVTNP